MDNILQLLSYLVLTSVAAERVTDMVKRTKIISWVAERSPIDQGLLYQAVSGATGGVLCYLSPPELALFSLGPVAMAITIGLATSGGSSVWSDLLQLLSTYRKGVQSLNAKG